MEGHLAGGAFLITVAEPTGHSHFVSASSRACEGARDAVLCAREIKMTTMTSHHREAHLPDYPSKNPPFTPSAANDDRSTAHARGERLAVPEKAEALRVRDVMSRHVVSVSPDTSIWEIADLLDKESASSLPVVDRTGRLVGVVSESDLITRAEIGTEPRRSWWRWIFLDAGAVSHDYVRSHGRKAGDVMTAHPITASEDEPLHKIAKRMKSKRLRRLPVVRDNRVVGIVSRSDLVRELASRAMESRASRRVDAAIREHLMARMDALPWNLRMRVANATIKNGVARIYGWVASDIERRALEVVAENTPGILEVKKHLQRARLI